MFFICDPLQQNQEQVLGFVGAGHICYLMQKMNERSPIILILNLNINVIIIGYLLRLILLLPSIPGIISRVENQRHVKVRFDHSDQEVIPIRFLIQMGGARPSPMLKVSDIWLYRPQGHHL